MLVNPQITNGIRSTATLKELIILAVLMWLYLFFMPFQYEKKSSKAFIRGEFLIFSNERTHLLFPPLRLRHGLEAVASRGLVMLCYGRALMMMLQTWWAEGSLRRTEDLPKPMERPDQVFLLP